MIRFRDGRVLRDWPVSKTTKAAFELADLLDEALAALREIEGQVIQARDGFGIWPYTGSESMTTTLKDVRAILAPCTDATIRDEWDCARSRNSSAPANTLCCVPNGPMPCSSGANLSTTADSKESIAPCSETSRLTKAASLSDRLMQSLISAGLIAGITPTSTRKRYGQAILDFASSRPDGNDADKPRETNRDGTEAMTTDRQESVVALLDAILGWRASAMGDNDLAAVANAAYEDLAAAPSPAAGPEPRNVRWMRLVGQLPQEEYSRIQRSDLYKIGDAIQVWVNEGDILTMGEEFTLPVEPPSPVAAPDAEHYEATVDRVAPSENQPTGPGYGFPHKSTPPAPDYAELCARLNERFQSTRIDHDDLPLLGACHTAIEALQRENVESEQRGKGLAEELADTESYAKAADKGCEELRDELAAAARRMKCTRADCPHESGVIAPCPVCAPSLADAYAAVNPLGGPAVVFDAMAERLRAGEDYYAVLMDYGFQRIPEPSPAAEPDAPDSRSHHPCELKGGVCQYSWGCEYACVGVRRIWPGNYTTAEPMAAPNYAGLCARLMNTDDRVRIPTLVYLCWEAATAIEALQRENAELKLSVLTGPDDEDTIHTMTDLQRIRVQACRPEDRAMLNTTAGAELVRCATESMEDEWARMSQDEGKAEREIERLCVKLAAAENSWQEQADLRAAAEAERDKWKDCASVAADERDSLRKFKAGVDEALNMGDGSYRP